MPAIQPVRLKIQISQLVEKYSSPNDFMAALKDMFDFYSDRTRKSGRGRPMYSLTRSYNVPVQVTRQIERALQPVATTDVENSLQLADILWGDNWLECRQLALSILSWIPAVQAESLIARIKRWGEESRIDRIMSASLAKALLSLGKNSPEIVFELLDYWLKSSETGTRKLGLRIIPSLVRDPTFMYLPRIFNMLTPFVQRVSLVPDVDLVEAIRMLAQKSPKETSYYLRRNLTLSENPGVYALIRQSLDAFTPAVKRELQAFLHQQREEFGNT
jgi:hypothetical protein